MWSQGAAAAALNTKPIFTLFVATVTASADAGKETETAIFNPTKSAIPYDDLAALITVLLIAFLISTCIKGPTRTWIEDPAISKILVFAFWVVSMHVAQELPKQSYSLLNWSLVFAQIRVIAAFATPYYQSLREHKLQVADSWILFVFVLGLGLAFVGQLYLWRFFEEQIEWSALLLPSIYLWALVASCCHLLGQKWFGRGLDAEATPETAPATASGSGVGSSSSEPVSSANQVHDADEGTERMV